MARTTPAAAHSRSVAFVPFQTWLPYASYFFQGIAFHEYPDVPVYPASHGCVRVPAPEAKGVYGFAPRWRAGLRAEALGLNNSVQAHGEKESFDPSYRYTAMADWTLTEFSRIRFQMSRGLYELEDGREEATEGFIQAIVSFGAHGAHSF